MSAVPDEPVARGGLGLWDTVSIIIGIVIGTTVFYSPWLIFTQVSNVWMGLIVWAAGGVLMLIGALCYAELATTYPRSGGDYVYLTRAFGPWAGFLFGWAQLTLLLTASIGIMGCVFGEYAIKLGMPDLADQWGVELAPDILYAGLAVLALSFLNILGVTVGKTTQNVLTAVKMLGLATIIVAGFAWGQPEHLTSSAALPADGHWWFRGLAVILVLYAYGGWNDAAFVAAEVRDVRRNLPRALVLGTAAIIVIYLLVNAAYVLGLGFEGVKATRTVPADLMARTPLEAQGARLISALILVSALGAINGLIFTGTRVYATLGGDYRLFAWLGTWRPGRGAPVIAIGVQALITLGLLGLLGTPRGHETVNQLLGNLHIDQAGAGDWVPYAAFDSLLSHTAPVFWLFFLLTGLSLFVLREKNPTRVRPFSVPLYPALPLAFCGMCIYMLYCSIDYVKQRSLLAFAVLAVGVVLYMVTRLAGTTASANEPAALGAGDGSREQAMPGQRVRRP